MTTAFVLGGGGLLGERLLGRAVRLVKSGTHLHAIEPLRRLLADKLPVSDFDDLRLPFHCVAAPVESDAWFWCPRSS